MVASLAEGDVEFDVRLQLQTDPHLMPIENNGVLWPERLSPRVSVATLRLPRQTFNSPAQMEFAKRLSYNPWHCIPEHRPLGNQSRARRRMYLRALEAAAHDERRAALRADGRRGLRVARDDAAVELHGPGAGRSRSARPSCARLLASMNDAPGRVEARQRADPVPRSSTRCTSRGCSSSTTRRSTTFASMASPPRTYPLLSRVSRRCRRRCGRVPGGGGAARAGRACARSSRAAKDSRRTPTSSRG